MTLHDIERQEAFWLTCGNQSAIDFLVLWRRYVHHIDDLIDGDLKGPEAMLGVFMQAAFVYTHPFFLEHMMELRQIAINCTNAYADSVMWEKSDVAWRREFADHYRHFGTEMVIVIAAICGGYAHARKVSPMLRELCWAGHHDERGSPV